MPIEALIGSRYEPPVEPLLLNLGFLTSHEQDGLAIRIKGEEDTPDAAICFASQFFHVRMLRSLQRVGMRPAEAWTFSFEKTSLGQDRILDSRRIHVKLSLEIVKEYDDPAHIAI